MFLAKRYLNTFEVISEDVTVGVSDEAHNVTFACVYKYMHIENYYIITLYTLV